MVRPWGDRRYFLEKRLAYVCSFELALQADLDRAQIQPEGLKVAFTRRTDQRSSFFHVLGQESAQGVDGRALDPPTGVVVEVLQTALFRERDGVGVLEGRLTLLTDDGAIVDSSCSGVARLLPSPDAESFATAAGFTGRVHLTLSCETNHRKYHWLCERQGIAFGTIKMGLLDLRDSRPVQATFDVYLAG